VLHDKLNVDDVVKKPIRSHGPLVGFRGMDGAHACGQGEHRRQD